MAQLANTDGLGILGDMRRVELQDTLQIVSAIMKLAAVLKI